MILPPRCVYGGFSADGDVVSDFMFPHDPDGM